MFQKLLDFVFGVQVHECSACEHILPSRRAAWHAGRRGPFVSVSRRLKIVSYK